MQQLYKTLVIISCMALCACASAQVRTVTFTGRDRTDQYHIPLHHIKVFNLDQLWEEVLYYPDTTLTMGTVGVEDHDLLTGLHLMQNVPNPFDGTTEFVLFLPEDNDVTLEIYDLAGKLTVSQQYTGLPRGSHLFRATLVSPQTYLLGASTRDGRTTIKMVNEGHGGENAVQHIGVVDGNGDITVYLKNDRTGTDYPFSLGDEMKYTGFVIVDSALMASNTVVKQQVDNDTISLIFDMTIPNVTTNSVSSVTTTTAICGGNVTSTGGTAVFARGVCWSTSQNPTVSDSHTTEGSGTGSFTSSISGLAANTTYYVRAYATNITGTSYGEENTFTTDTLFICGNIVYDWENHPYNTVQIGNQCWIKQNLRTTHYADGTSIQYGGSNGSETTAYYYYPNASSSTMASYGLLYNWSAVMHGESSSNANPSGVQGVCPKGWHVPSHVEWAELTHYVGSQSQYVCGNSSSDIAKALASTSGWNNSNGYCDVGNNQSSNNATGFGAMPANYGWGDYIGEIGEWAEFWSATGSNSIGACDYSLAYYLPNVMSPDGGTSKTAGLSVRCLCNAFYMETPEVTTNELSNVTSNSATCGGNVISDGETPVTARGLCWSSYPYPIVSDSHTTNGSGTGVFTSNVTGLSAGATYYVRAYATNSAGTAYGEQRIINTIPSYSGVDGQPCSNVAAIVDYDENSYPTVQIGSQCWMARNLRTTHYADGVSIADGGSNSSSTVPYYYNYTSSSISLENRGFLYNWPAVMRNASTSITNPSTVQGICPNGWHVPSDAEWTQLANYVSSQSQYLCNNDSTYIAKALASTTGWAATPYTCSVGYMQSNNNITGFSSFPAGYSYDGSSFCDSHIVTHFVSASESNSSEVYYRRLYCSYKVFERLEYFKSAGYSVRCIKN